MSGLRLYARYLATSIKSQLQYKTSFIMGAIGHLLITGIEFFGLWALFDRFGSIAGWRLPEVAFFYGVVHITFAFADALARGFDVFDTFVKSGEFDRMLLRPRSTEVQLLGFELTLRRVGRLAQGIAVLVWAISVLEIGWSVGKIAIVAFSITGGIALFAGVVVLQATLSFWTVETLEIMNTLTYGGVEATQYPLDVYRKWFQRFFTFFVPLACVSYFPLSAVLEKQTPGFSPTFGAVAPSIGFLFAVLALVLWRFGIRHYTSTGS